MTKTVKKPNITLIYNNKNVTRDLSKSVADLSYSDYEKGEADELDITLNDNLNKFKAAWKPTKGDKVSAKINYTNDKVLNCGIFTVDEVSLDSSDDGDTVAFKAVAASTSENLREKQNYAYEGKTLIQIADIIGSRHGFTVAGREGNVKIGRVTQYMETDLGFLNRVSNLYGYIFKITDDVLTFLKVDDLEKAKPLSIIKKSDISHLHLDDKSIQTYSGCEVSYLNPKTGRFNTYKAKGKKSDVKRDILKIRQKCENKEQAKIITDSALKQTQVTIEGTFDLKSGNPYGVSGCNCTLEEYGNYNGKYHITQSHHHVTSEDWTTSIDVRRLD